MAAQVALSAPWAAVGLGPPLGSIRLAPDLPEPSDHPQHGGLRLGVRCPRLPHVFLVRFAVPPMSSGSSGFMAVELVGVGCCLGRVVR